MKFTTNKEGIDFNMIEVERERMKMEKRLAVAEELNHKLEQFLKERLTPIDYNQFLSIQNEYMIKLQMLK